jgi:hypothetical protein
MIPFGGYVKQSPDWKAAQVNVFIDFSIDGHGYKILKDKYYYSIFDGDNLIGKYRKVASEFSSKMAEIFDFKLKLINREGHAVCAAPAFMLLPFYLDQDTGWGECLQSFQNLNQFKRWKEPTVEYHTGLRPGEYYELKGAVEELALKQIEVERELQALHLAKNRMKENWREIEMGIDVEQFQDEIRELLDEYSQLKKSSDRYRTEIADLVSRKEVLNSQIAIAAHVRKEMEADFVYATQGLDDGEIACPTCGAEYHNSFSQTFSIAEDEGRIQELLDLLRVELEGVEDILGRKKFRDDDVNQRINKIECLLSEKKGAIKLKDIIAAESRREIDSAFVVEINTLEESHSEIIGKMNGIEKKIKTIDNKDRRRSIREFFNNRLVDYCDLLEVPGMTIKAGLVPKIQATGSEGPRSVLAYALALALTIREKGTRRKVPIIVDSPNQKAQDAENLAKMIRLLMSNREPGGQMILGLEDVVDINFKEEYGIEVINLTEKRQLLSKVQFDVVYAEVKPYFHAALNARLGRAGA